MQSKAARWVNKRITEIRSEFKESAERSGAKGQLKV